MHCLSDWVFLHVPQACRLPILIMLKATCPFRHQQFTYGLWTQLDYVEVLIFTLLARSQPDVKGN